jgi:hypothetical protein
MQVFKDADPELVNILENALDPATVTEHGVYGRDHTTLPDTARAPFEARIHGVPGGNAPVLDEGDSIKDNHPHPNEIIFLSVIPDESANPFV